MPSCRAFLHHGAGEAFLVAALRLASTMAASLADRVSSQARDQPRRVPVTEPPSGTPILVGWALWALAETGKASPSDRRPNISAAKVR